MLPRDECCRCLGVAPSSIVYRSHGIRHLYRGVTASVRDGAERPISRVGQIATIRPCRKCFAYGRAAPEMRSGTGRVAKGPVAARVPINLAESCGVNHFSLACWGRACGETPRNVTVSAVSDAGYLRDPPGPCGLRANAPRTRGVPEHSPKHDRRQSVSATADHAEERTNPAAGWVSSPDRWSRSSDTTTTSTRSSARASRSVTGTELVDEEYDDVRRRRAAVVPRGRRRPDRRAGGRHRDDRRRCADLAA